jgi:GT2 family glycosyltransferase
MMESSPHQNPSVVKESRQAFPDVSIVLVCWNNKDYLDPCLQSLLDSNLKCTYDVIVVDNGSIDGSQDMLRQKYPDVMLIQNPDNLGLGKASNQGIEATRGKYVLLLNNDTIVNGQSLDAMVNFLDDHPEAGAVGGKLLNQDGSLQAGYAKFSTLGEEFLIAVGLGDRIWAGFPSHYDTDQIVEAGWLSSACLLLRRSALDKVGLLDENYFIYGDEADLQYRLYKDGWKVYYLPYATTIHYGGRSMNRWRRRRLVYRGKLLFYKKHYGSFQTGVLRVMLCVLSFLKLLIWGVAYVVPARRDRAQKEIRSNLDVIGLCFNLH